MQKNIAFLILSGLLSAFVAPPLVGQDLTSTGALSGTVSSTSGAPVGGIQVAAVRVFPIQSLSTPPIAYTHTDAAGHYRFQELGPASYKICALVQGVPLLDPCLWSDNPPLWNVAAGQDATLNVRIDQGEWLQVRFEDSDGAVARKEQSGSRPAVSVGVRTTQGYIENLRQISSDERGPIFRIAVPREKDIDLSIDADNLDVEDRTGKRIDGKGRPETVRVGSGGRVLEFRVKSPAGGDAK